MLGLGQLANYWEDYMPFFTVNTFPEQYDCGPVAIVNALIAYGQKHGRSDLQYDDFLSVFDKVLEVNDASGGEYYTEDIPEGEISGGTFLIQPVNISRSVSVRTA